MLAHFFRELIRRNVLRVAAIYIILGWLMRRFTDMMIPVLDLPPVFSLIVTLLIFFGLPVCLALSWLYDYTPEGLKLTPAASPEELQAAYKLSRTDILLSAVIGLILVVVGIDTFHREAPAFVARPEPVETVAATNGFAEEAMVLADAPQNESVAVLPFADESPQRDQAYFSDGVAEEILTALVRVNGLKVAGRASSFALRDTDLNLLEIGDLLKVAHILEGAVRKQGNTLRVTVRLLKVSDGSVVWSNSFDGQVEDVFDVQETIAKAVARELEVVLSGEDMERLSLRQTDNIEAHNAYLRGRRFLNARIGDNLPKAVDAFQEAVQLDPDYAPAWAGLASAHALMPQYRVVDFFDAYTQGELNARRAIQINPDMAEPYSVLGWINLQRRNYIEMREQFENALEIDAEDITTNLWYGIGNVATGEIADADRRFTFVVERDPVALVGVHMQSLVAWMLGRTEEAERRAIRVYRMGYTPAGLQLGEIYGERGEFDRSAEFVALAMRGMATRFTEEEQTILGLGFFGDEAARQAATALATQYASADGPKQELFIPYFLIQVGEVETAFSLYEDNRAAFDPLIYYAIWGPYGEEAREHPEFPGFADRVGLTDYWQRYGWPDICLTPGATSLACG